MTEASTKSGAVWPVVLAGFEQHAPASVMARTALDYAFPPDWVDLVFEATRQRQYARRQGAHVFNSRFNSLRNRQSVPSAMIFWGLDLIMPASCSRSA